MSTCGGGIRKIVYEVDRMGRFLKNEVILNYRVLGSYDGPLIISGGENKDHEIFTKQIETSKLRENIKKGKCILAERIDNDCPLKKYMLTELISEILDEQNQA